VLFDPAEFPNLNAANHRDIDPTDYIPTYNCLAWSLGIDDDVLSSFDGHTWPGNAPRNDAFIMTVVIMYESRGFCLCTDGSLEGGYDKIALYVQGNKFTHVARQLENGKWTSKMGADVDIEHDAPDDLAGPCYGCVATFMKRQG